MDSNAWWGTNHLRFLPFPYIVFYATICIFVVVSLSVASIAMFVHRRMLNFAKAYLIHHQAASVLIALSFAPVFWFFRAKTQFLGDGYTILSLFGSKDFYFYKWTEIGAILILRGTQSLFGEYSQSTALSGLQVLSVLSGIVTIWNLLQIGRRISGSAESFLTNAPCLILAGSLALFFGYAEFYHLLWAAATTFLHATLYYWQTGKRISLVLLAYLLTVAIHLQALYWAPGVVYLAYERLKGERPFGRSQKLLRFMLLLGIASTIVSLTWFITSHYAIRDIFLHPFTGKPDSPDYAIFTSKHFVDIANEVLLLIPAVLILAVLAFRAGFRLTPENKFFAWLALGSILFLLVVDPTLGMARDWDLMSLTLLPLLMILLIQTSKSCTVPTPAVANSITAICLTGVILFVSVVVEARPSEERFLSVLNYYGSKNRAGWVILSSYYAQRKDWKEQERVNIGLRRYFPDEALMVKAYEELDHRNYAAAFAIAEQLYRKDSTRTDYMQIYGNTLAKLGHYPRAVQSYERMLSIRPYFAQGRKELGLILMAMNRYDDAMNELSKAWNLDRSLTAAAEGIALGYIKLGAFDSAETVATKIEELGTDRAGVHLIRMVLALNREDVRLAKKSFAAFKAEGKSRPDFQDIIDYYNYLDSTK